MESGACSRGYPLPMCDNSHIEPELRRFGTRAAVVEALSVQIMNRYKKNLAEGFLVDSYFAIPASDEMGGYATAIVSLNAPV
jgi:hypothetical protein